MWRCTFADDFDEPALDADKWIVQQTASSGYHSGPECFVDRPGNVSIADGSLRLTVRQEPSPFQCDHPTPGLAYTTQYTSGMISTYERFTQTYGRFEVRARLPAATVRGLQTSFWMWPEDRRKYGLVWPASGEIDIAEWYSAYPDRVIPYVHYLGSSENVTNNHCYISDVTAFHTYAVEWTSEAITIAYDGQICLVNRWTPLFPLQHPQPFDQPFMIVLTQALGINTNAFDPAITPLPATTVVDYVRIWA